MCVIFKRNILIKRKKDKNNFDRFDLWVMTGEKAEGLSIISENNKGSVFFGKVA